MVNDGEQRQLSGKKEEFVMKKKLMSAILSVMLAVALAACGSADGKYADAGAGKTTAEAQAGGSESAGTGESSTPAAGSGNQIVINMGSGFSTLDPSYVYEQNPPLVINACYETLFKIKTGEDSPSPLLAESYSFSDDAKDLTIKLNKDAKFASGNDVTSADVAFSLLRCKNLKGNPSFIVDNIDSIDCPDDDTVVIHQKTPDSAILSKLCYSACSILDSKVVKEQGGTDAEDAATADKAQNYLNTASAGSGMYTLESYTPDEEIDLVKNPNYWGKANNIDRVVIKLTDDSNAQMMGLSTGDVDIAMNLNDDTISELSGNADVTTSNTATKTVAFLMMNEDESIGGPVSDSKVQQAIRYAVDYKGIQNVTGVGTVTPKSFIQDGFLGSEGKLDADTATDTEKAKKLLAEAGYPDGFDVDLTVCDLDMEGVPLLDLAQKVKEDLAKAGINVNIVQQNWSGGYGDAYREGKLGFTVMYWGIDYNDPNVQLAFLPGQTVGLRASWKDDSAYKDLYNQILAATDDDTRAELLKKAQEQMDADSPFIFIAQAPCHIGYRNRLSGVQFRDDIRLDLTEVNVK